MYIFNPTREDVTRGLGNREYFIPAGKAIEVEPGIGEFILEARGELVGVPPGGLTWFGLVPITSEDKLPDVAKRGLQNYKRLLTHRILAAEQSIQEALATDGKETFQSTQLRKNENFTQWRRDLEWVEAILSGEKEYELNEDALIDLGKQVIPKQPPKGIKIV